MTGIVFECTDVNNTKMEVRFNTGKGMMTKPCEKVALKD